MNEWDRLCTVISEQLGVDEEGINEYMNFQEDFGADSLDLVELVMGIESEFDIDVPDEDFSQFKTVSDVYKYLTK